MTGTVLSASGSSSGASGYIQFSGGSGAFASSSITAGQQFFWDETNHRLGIGLVAPTQSVDVAGKMTSNSMILKPVVGAAAPTAGSGLWTTNGTDVWRTTGKVGIGTASPTGVFVAQSPAVSTQIIDAKNHSGVLISKIIEDGNGDGQLSLFTSAGAENIVLSPTAGSYFMGGRVGIGTASPGYLLDVVGAAGAGSPVGTVETLGTTLSDRPAFLLKSPSYNAYINLEPNTGTFNLGTQSLNRVSITLTGNVGIGTTSPASLLDVGGAMVERASPGTPSLTWLGDIAGANWTTAQGNSALTFYNDSSTGTIAWPVTSITGYSKTWYPKIAFTQTGDAFVAGNVGIGTTTPGFPLTVASGSAQFPIALSILPSTHATSRRAALMLDDWQLLQDASGNGTKDLSIWQNSIGAHRLYIGTSGKVGIGNAAPDYLLHVGSASASGIVLKIQNSSGYCTMNPITTTWSCSSDLRLKKDVADAGEALPWLLDMRIRNFAMRSDGSKMTGVIAQEMLPTHPEMVHMNNDGYYTVDAPNPWKLVKAMQELKADNDNLRAHDEAEFKALRAEIEALKAAR